MPTETCPQASPINQEAPGELTAGDALRQQRLRLGLSEKQVADKLHITMHYVRALEANHFEKLPGAVFTRGYIKNYALLAGLEADDLLARHDEFASQQQAVIAEAGRLKERWKKDRNKPFVILSLLLFVGGFIVLGLATSYFNRRVISEAPASAEVASNPANSVAPAINQQETEHVAVQSPQLTLLVEDDAATSAVSLIESITAAADAPGQAQNTGSDQLLPASLPSEFSSDDDSIAPVQKVPVAIQTNDERSATTTEDSEPDSAVNADLSRIIEVAAPGKDVLRISFSGESWIEVNDSESRQIYQDLRGTGDILEITGTAPFALLLGNAPFTRISLNGREIDLSDNIRIDNSARLTVGL